MKLENTVQEVQRRILKLVGNDGSINETLNYSELYPHFDTKRLQGFEAPVLELLAQTGIRLQTSTYDKARFQISPQQPEIMKGQLERLDPGKLDLVERSYRLASKVLKQTRDYCDPNTAIANTMSVLKALPSGELLDYSNRISELITRTRKTDQDHGVLLTAFLIEGMSMVATNSSQLNAYLGKVEQICKEHDSGKRYNAHESAQELIGYTKTVLGLEEKETKSKYSPTPKTRMDPSEMMEFFDDRDPKDAVRRVQYFGGGELVAVDRSANASTKKISFTLTFRDDDGRANNMLVPLGNSPTNRELKMMYGLIPVALENVQGLEGHEKVNYVGKTTRARQNMEKHDGITG